MKSELSVQQGKKVMLDRILQLLGEETEIYAQLGKAVSAKQQAILSNDIAAIKQKTEQEQLLAKSANGKTVERYELMKLALNHSQVPSMTEFLFRNGLASDARWTRLSRGLNESVEQIKRTNRENAQLLQTSLRFTQDLIRMYYPAEKATTTTYTRQGKTSGKGSSTLLNRGI